MSERKEINLEEIIDFFLSKNKWYLNNRDKNIIKDMMKEACYQTLVLASDNADVELNDWALKYSGNEVYKVNKESILNTINQIKK